MHGILLVDKPLGWTSFDAVNKVRRFIEAAGLNDTGRKRFPVGHTGTLDPMATGLLVLLLGKDTRRAPELTKLDKTYLVTMHLGQTSTTGDSEGELTVVSTAQPELRDIQDLLDKTVGPGMQTPPQYSAIKVNGQRAYKLARAGKEVKLEPRPVTIKRLQLLGYSYPEVQFVAEVSSGTYIRSLVEDFGKALGTGAYMSALRRTEVGEFNISNAVSPENLTAETIQEHLIV
ncbi:MAG TPA: tRNA pseudouridine(55) synthase TruB [Candidatus Saccharimonadales bacterium]|nr:tRNA pseudouridine(55) synthase TruB [Candidatus Saccharimonadales bacterium]